MTKIDSKIPEGPVAEKWTNYKAHQKLVNPANKRRLDIIVVGTGLAGASKTLRVVRTLLLHKVVSMQQRIIKMTVTPFTVCSTIQ